MQCSERGRQKSLPNATSVIVIFFFAFHSSSRGSFDGKFLTVGMGVFLPTWQRVAPPAVRSRNSVRIVDAVRGILKIRSRPSKDLETSGVQGPAHILKHSASEAGPQATASWEPVTLPTVAEVSGEVKKL
jgi:hypothetical protein